MEGMANMDGDLGEPPSVRVQRAWPRRWNFLGSAPFCFSFRSSKRPWHLGRPGRAPGETHLSRNFPTMPCKPVHAIAEGERGRVRRRPRFSLCFVFPAARSPVRTVLCVTLKNEFETCCLHVSSSLCQVQGEAGVTAHFS